MSKFHKRHTPVGASPGTLMIPREAPKPVIRVMDFGEADVTEKEIRKVDQLDAFLKRPTVTWVDVQGLGDETVLREIARVFDMHELALEDVVNVPQRPKVEHHDVHTLIITRMIRPLDVTRLHAEQVGIFVGKNYVLTFQETYGDVFDPVRARIRKAKSRLRQYGPDYLAYALLDTVIDAYYPVLEKMGESLEQLEEEIIDHPTHESLQRMYEIRRELLTLRRALWPQREAINSVLRDESEYITDDVRIFLRDTYDHCVQLIDGTETYRELVGSLMDTYLSSVSNRQNEGMKVLTITATIFIPLTFLAGVYGMNFQHMPELHARWGYPIILVTMGIVAIGMVLYFRRLGWISHKSKESPSKRPESKSQATG